MKLARLTIGIVLVGLAIFVIVGEQLAGTSANAFINARLTTTKAPIQGHLTLEPVAIGTRIRSEQTLGFLDDSLVDSSRLNDLLAERARAEAEITRLEMALTATRSAVSLLEERARLYGRERLRQMEAELAASKSVEEAWRAQLRLYQMMLERSSRLSTTGIETTSGLEQAQSRVDVAQRELERAQAQTVAISVGLDAARRGVFLGDGYNDAPYSEQRVSELQWQEQELSAGLAAQKAILEALRRRIDEERLTINRLSHASLEANVNGILWTLKAANGETVQRGQDIYQLVDCESTIVTLSVTEGAYNSLELGQPAQFRPTGETTVLDGVIIRLAGSGAQNVYQNLAVGPSQEHLGRYDVALSVPGLLGDDKLRCGIGRTGRVFFEPRPLDWLRKFWR
ncbi:MAG TPA: curli assembly protein CsgC [Rhizobium sp.]|nr:curli assembly protein CsgC [Rhizobium sp.]